MNFIFKLGKKRLIILGAGLLLIIFAAGGSLAYMTSTGDNVTNNFHAGTGDVYITENVENGSKSQIRIHNSGNMAVYVRAAVIANWVNEDGCIAAAPALKLPSDLGSGWREKDGIYYYVRPLAPKSGDTEEHTSALFADAIRESAYDRPSKDARLVVTVLAESVQAEGTTEPGGGIKAVVDAWGLDPSKL